MRTRLFALAIAGLMLACSPGGVCSRLHDSRTKRTADGKPDFSGTWIGNGGGITDAVPVAGGGEEGVSSQAPKNSVYQGGNAPKVPTRSELAKQLPLTPKGQELVAEYLKKMTGRSVERRQLPEIPQISHHFPCGAVSPAELGVGGTRPDSMPEVWRSCRIRNAFSWFTCRHGKQMGPDGLDRPQTSQGSNGLRAGLDGSFRWHVGWRYSGGRYGQNQDGTGRND